MELSELLQSQCVCDSYLVNKLNHVSLPRSPAFVLTAVTSSHPLQRHHYPHFYTSYLFALFIVLKLDVVLNLHINPHPIFFFKTWAISFPYSPFVEECRSFVLLCFLQTRP